MKKLLTTFILSLITVMISAQDWKILNENHIYYFSRSDSNGVTNSIRFENVIPLGDTTVYVLFDNYLAPKDTCISSDEEVIQAPENSFFDNIYLEETLELCNYFGLNRGSFIGKEIIAIENGDYVLNPGELLIRTLADLNDTWIFDPLSGVTATVVSIASGIYIDTPDTLKTIYLSSGDTLVISKNFGLIQYPVGNGAYYHSEGVQGTGVGYTFPSFEDVFYSYDIGDAFALSFSVYAVDPPLVTGNGAIFKFEITDIDSSENEIKYITDVCGSISTYFWDSTAYNYFQLADYYYNPDSLFRKSFGYPGEIKNFTLPTMKDIFPYNSALAQYYGDEIGFHDLYSNNKYGYNEFNGIFPQFIIDMADSLEIIWKGYLLDFEMTEQTGLTTISNAYPGYQVEVNNLLNYGLYEEFFIYEMSFMEGVGLLHLGSADYGNEVSINLSGLRKDGITYGSLSNCTLVGITDVPKPDINIKIYPIPFANEITILNDNKQSFQLEVTNILGEKVFQTKINQGENHISLKDFSGNTFILRFISKNEVYTKKIIRVNR
jgi:hypothetical protein